MLSKAYNTVYKGMQSSNGTHILIYGFKLPKNIKSWQNITKIP